MDGITAYILDHHWADYASIFGVLLTIIGFAVTITGVFRSKTAAQQTQAEVHRVRVALLHYDTVAELSAAMAVMDEIRRLHRVGAWQLLPDRYSILRRMLISIRTADQTLSDTHKAALLGATQQFKELEQRAEKVTVGGKTPDTAKLNHLVSEQIDRLEEVLAAIRRNVEV